MREKIAKEFEMMCLADKTHCDGSCRECGLSAADAILALEHPSKTSFVENCPHRKYAEQNKCTNKMRGDHCDNKNGIEYHWCHIMRPATIGGWLSNED